MTLTGYDAWKLSSPWDKGGPYYVPPCEGCNRAAEDCECPSMGWRVVWLPKEGAAPDEHRDFTDEEKARIFADHWRLVAAKMVLRGDADPGVRIQVEEIEL